MAATSRQRLSDDQLRDLLALVDDADNVELKLTVPEADQRSAVEGWGWTRWTPRSGRSTSLTRPS